MNGCMQLIKKIYDLDAIKIMNECEAEGLPSTGSDYELRTSHLWESIYAEWYDEACTYTS